MHAERRRNAKLADKSKKPKKKNKKKKKNKNKKSKHAPRGACCSLYHDMSDF